MKRLPRWLRITGWVLAALAGLAGLLLLEAWTPMGAAPSGARLKAVQSSPQFANGKFRNPVETHMIKPGQYPTMLKNQFFGNEVREPTEPIPIVELDAQSFAEAPASGLRLTWIGHATTLVEIDGYRVLFDPVFSNIVSPVSFLGPGRFFPPPVSIADLPDIDAVVISHDHYDHLDYASILELAPKTKRFVVPLGIGAHLDSWGIPARQIVELDWWQETTSGNDLRMIATPARHYSGRGLTDSGTQLWASWAIIGPRHRVFFSGDTGYMKLFQDVGSRLGPFDTAIVKAGAYDITWDQIHMMPEDSVAVAQDVRAKQILPVHWGTFNLAQHGWTEPIMRTLVAAKAVNLPVVMPKPGQSFEPSSPPAVERWWPSVPWKRAAAGD